MSYNCPDYYFLFQTYSQQTNYRDNFESNNSQKLKLKPVLNYTAGSSVTVIPHFGTLTDFTFSPSLSIPLSPKWTIDGGIIARRYYSALPYINPEGASHAIFNDLTVYGSASYQINPQLTVYGVGLRQLSATSPYDVLPKSSYTIGSRYKFGNFSIGVNFRHQDGMILSHNFHTMAHRDFFLHLI